VLVHQAHIVIGKALLNTLTVHSNTCQAQPHHHQQAPHQPQLPPQATTRASIIQVELQVGMASMQAEYQSSFRELHTATHLFSIEVFILALAFCNLVISDATVIYIIY
jgi:hypothetical protein